LGIIRGMGVANNVMAWRGLLVSWDAWLVVVVVAVLVPARGYVVYRRLLPSGGHDLPSRVKVRIYASTIAIQWVLAAGTVLIARRHGLSLPELGQTLGRTQRTLEVTAGLLVLAVVFLGVNLFQVLRARPSWLAAGVRRLRGMLPVSGSELAAFVGVSLTAGICEELLYRGWLVTFLAALLGSVVGGVVVGAVVFGLAHAYQGSRGMLLAGVLGLLFGAVFVVVGSLVPGQVLHAAVDVVGGVTGAVAVSRLKGMETEGSDSAPVDGAAS
jgi:membrane protease YdiL (CAAX protease family)